MRYGRHTETRMTGLNLSVRATSIWDLLAARICAAASGGQLLVTQTVCDLVEGSRVTASDLGEFALKGFSTPRRLFSVVGHER